MNKQVRRRQTILSEILHKWKSNRLIQATTRTRTSSSCLCLGHCKAPSEPFKLFQDECRNIEGLYLQAAPPGKTQLLLKDNKESLGYWIGSVKLSAAGRPAGGAVTQPAASQLFTEHLNTNKTNPRFPGCSLSSGLQTKLKPGRLRTWNSSLTDI